MGTAARRTPFGLPGRTEPAGRPVVHSAHQRELPPFVPTGPKGGREGVSDPAPRLQLSALGEVMLVRSRAPLRLGLAGGGTDVSPFSDIYGGSVLNATISSYAYATIESRSDGNARFCTADRGEVVDRDALPRLPIDGDRKSTRLNSSH